MFCPKSHFFLVLGIVLGTSPCLHLPSQLIMHKHPACPTCGKRHWSLKSSSTSTSINSSSFCSNYEVRSPSHSARVCQESNASLLGVSPAFLRNPRLQGYTYNVSYARNYIGGDSGKVSVVKWVRKSHRCANSNHLEMAVRISEKTGEIVYNFLKAIDTHGWSIVVNKPRIIGCEGVKHTDRSSGCALVEPYVSHVKRFNSSSGRQVTSHHFYDRLMQALSHFSHTWSKGNLILCNLQGGVSRRDRRIVIFSPSIMSRDGNVFGCSDAGSEGMSRFLRRHKCNEFCLHKRRSLNEIFVQPWKEYM